MATIDEKIFEKPEGELAKEVDEPLTEERIAALKNFAESIGIEFKNFVLLNRALTHKSYAREFDPKLKNNERTATYLFEHFTNLTEGELTKTRSSLTRQSTLTRLAEKIHIDDVLLLGVTEKGSLRGRDSNLEDAFESVIGAIYLECGWETAKNYVLSQMIDEFERVKVTGVPKDYKSKLQEVIQRNPNRKVTYTELNEEGPPHMRTFEAVAASAKAKNLPNRKLPDMHCKISANCTKKLSPT